jgi:diadenosine tetraphosphate (Ap4A) HIT family hydrolase
MSDFSLPTYLAVQKVVYRVGEALTRLLPTERLYVLSVGSLQGNAHVHWHVAPLPPGTPFECQQFAAFDRDEYLDVPEVEMAELAACLRAELAHTTSAGGTRGRSISHEREAGALGGESVSCFR